MNCCKISWATERKADNERGEGLERNQSYDLIVPFLPADNEELFSEYRP